MKIHNFKDERKILSIFYGELGKAKAELFSAQTRVKVLNHFISKKEKRLDMETEYLRKVIGLNE